MNKFRFLDKEGSFAIEAAENYSSLYFPIAGEMGIKSALTPNLGGDSKLNQNTFILEPVSVENLHNNRSTRNFWCCVDGVGIWSAVGQSAEQEAVKFTAAQDRSEVVAGFMRHEVIRQSSKYQLKATIRSFVPLEHNVEVMFVEIMNTGSESIRFSPVAAIPIYGRSADNIRDHRHVTSLLHRIRTTEHGVYIRPTLSFDERGHQTNNLTYFVCGITGDGEQPEGFYPIVENFIGDGGTFTRPRALLESASSTKAGSTAEGKEALGGIRFHTVELEPQKSVCYTILIGATTDENEIPQMIDAMQNKELVIAQQRKTDEYWQNQVNIHYHTGNIEFDNYMRWVSFQPFLRRLYGCSFLPHHDYGKGGRGWRDLWQDCLALLMMNPSGVRQMILDNYGGVRIDGTNATIIGEKQGEFIADRNNITRVWMDHGVWPFLTTKLYMEQTGDVDILNEPITYFKDQQVERGTAIDEFWDKEYGKQQKNVRGEVYKGTVLEHLLLQHLCAFYEVGEHNHIRLRGADWNDAIDMAEERGESVAFTCAYAGNLKQLARYVRLLKNIYHCDKIQLMEEMVELLVDDSDLYDDIDKKLAILKRFERQCKHQVSGIKVSLDAEQLAQNLLNKAEWMMGHIRKNEWITDRDGNGWFNSYYDNHGNQVEGVFENEVRMMLTGQVFALMSNTASPLQMKEVCKSTKKYLYEKEVGGYRINTNFHEEKYDMGRMFGFAYGEKENGAVFSHMTVMYANALYQNGFVREGYEALQTLADTALNFETSRMYPGIPEYFNNEGRGMYSYLTGAASWYMLTMVTEAFGVKGELGNLVVEPKLVKEQFDQLGYAKLSMIFAGKQIEVVYHNPHKKDFGEYRIVKVSEGISILISEAGSKAVIVREDIEKLENELHRIMIELN